MDRFETADGAIDHLRRSERGELLGELHHVSETPAGVFLETLPDGRPKGLRQLGRWGDGWVPENAHEEQWNAFTPERELACHELVEHDAERPDVRSTVDVAWTTELLGRHVWRRARVLVVAG